MTGTKEKRFPSLLRKIPGGFAFLGRIFGILLHPDHRIFVISGGVLLLSVPVLYFIFLFLSRREKAKASDFLLSENLLYGSLEIEDEPFDLLSEEPILISEHTISEIQPSQGEFDPNPPVPEAIEKTAVQKTIPVRDEFLILLDELLILNEIIDSNLPITMNDADLDLLEKEVLSVP